MVAGYLEDYKKYLFNKSFEKGFEFIFNFIKNPLKKGKYEIDGENVFALVQEYQPKKEGSFESHKNYIDIQYIFSGSEIIEWCNISDAKAEKDLTPEKDVILYYDCKDKSSILLKQNGFAIFFPSDLHKPGLIANDNNVIKIVIKIKQ